MAYILNNDKQEDFECSLALEGASLDDSMARVILEINDTMLMFKGTIDESGKCHVPIKNLKKIFPKEATGNMKLEVIAEDTYFSPWEDSVTIKPSKVVTVESVKLNKEPEKPKMVVEVKEQKVEQKPVKKPSPNINELCESLIKQGFNKTVIYKNKKQSIPVLGKVIHEYYKAYDMKPEKGAMKEILNNL
jgi:hypothetical protein